MPAHTHPVVVEGYAEAKAGFKKTIQTLNEAAKERKESWKAMEKGFEALGQRFAEMEARADERHVEMVAHVDEGNAIVVQQVAQHIDDVLANARKDDSHYHLYVHLGKLRDNARITLDKHNKIETLSMIAKVQRAVNKTYSEQFSGKALRICVSSAETENLDQGLGRVGADVLVFSGKSGEQYDVELGSTRTHTYTL